MLENNEMFGEFSQCDQIALRRLIQEVKKPGCVIVEVGSWLGNGSTRVIIEELRSVEGAKLYCVDTWNGTHNVVHHQKIASNHDIFDIYTRNIKSQGAELFVYPLRMMSVEAAKIFESKSIDMVFIDGDHAYKSIKEDIYFWKSKVRDGGILCGHDCECRPQDLPKSANYTWQRDLDSIDGKGTIFSHLHIGVIAAVEEAFNGSANLWSETQLQLADGSVGRATLWDALEAPLFEKNKNKKTSSIYAAPVLIEKISSINIVFYGGLYYCCPENIGPIDLSQYALSELPSTILIYDDIKAARASISCQAS